MDKSIKTHIENTLSVRISDIRSVSGGDISQAFLLETGTERFFCKVNDLGKSPQEIRLKNSLNSRQALEHLNLDYGVNRNKDAYAMFLAEKQGLEAISRTETIATPTVLLCEASEKGGFLLMEYVEPKRPSIKDMELLGHQLAALHQCPDSKNFGWKADNFIGSLTQRNTRHTDWATFYIQERLLPQLHLALDSGKLATNEIPSEERLFEICERFFPKEIEPALLHGDLWSGNYLISTDGTPFLIDPATYYGHYEVDISMTKLFGGFTPSFYLAYEDHFSKMGGEKERADLYQLYYLLVHLNLFGASYRVSVQSILQNYF